MDVVLRPAAPSDRAFLLAVYGSTRADELATTDLDDDRKAAFVLQQFEAQDAYYQANYANARYDIIEIDVEPAGRLYTARWPDEIRIMDIAVLPAFRRRGAGERLLRQLLAEAGSEGKAVRIHVERFNPALTLYARLGFRLVEDRGVYLFLEWSPTADPSQENTAS